MRWLSLYLGVVGVLHLVALVVLLIVVVAAARGRGKVLGAIGFGVVALGSLIGLLSGVITTVLSSTSDEAQTVLVVVNVVTTLVFLVGLGVLVSALVTASRESGGSATTTSPVTLPRGPVS